MHGRQDGPLVSVIIPTWNRLELVRQAIASVVAQTYENWELIVVDDGSTDRTVEELRKVDDPRISVFASVHLGDLGRLRDLGAATAKGEWFAFLDSDDLWLPEKLGLQFEALARTGAGWSYTLYDLMSEDGSWMPLRAGVLRPISGWIIDDLLELRTGVCAGTVLVERQLFESVGGFSKNNIYAYDDLDFAFRAALASEAVALPQSLTRIRVHQGSLGSALDLSHHYKCLVYERILADLSDAESRRRARKMLAHHLSEAGAQRIARREFPEAMRCFVRAMALGDSPGHLLRASTRRLRQLIAA